jgi:cysteine desulfurase
MTASPIYLDHNASTPTDPAVIERVAETMRKHFANPSSTDHAAGHAANEVVSEAREDVAALLGCAAKEIIFTSGSTESNALALLGSFERLKAVGRDEVVISQIEHLSVLACASALEARGAKITKLPVGENGQVSLNVAKEVITERTGLVSIMAANNETGIIQPIEEIARLSAAVGAYFHTDFSQATAFLPLDLSALPIHLASFSAHKFYGPKGVGALFVRSRRPRVKLDPVIPGGGQERGWRSGTLNTPAIAGLGLACRIVRVQIKDDIERVSRLKHQFIDRLKTLDGVQINGDPMTALANTVSISINGVEPLALMHATRDRLIFSASSACSTEKVETSHVLRAMLGDGERAREAFRIGLGRGTTSADIEVAAAILVEAATRLRAHRHMV